MGICGIEPLVEVCSGSPFPKTRREKGCRTCDRYKAWIAEGGALKEAKIKAARGKTSISKVGQTSFTNGRN